MEPTVAAAVDNSWLFARRANGHWLRLRLQANAPHQIVIRLLCFQSGWIFEEDLGLVLPGDERIELQLLGWPAEATLLQAELRPLQGPPEKFHRWLAAPALQTPYLCS
jgi:hypothetical protein